MITLLGNWLQSNEKQFTAKLPMMMIVKQKSGFYAVCSIVDVSLIPHPF